MTENSEDRPTSAAEVQSANSDATLAPTPGPVSDDDSADSRGQENVEDRPNVSTVDPDDYPEQQ